MQRRDFLKYSAFLGAATMLPAWSRFAFAAQERPALGIPPLLTTDNAQKITLNIQQGKMAFIPGKTTQTWGYNGDLLGPALKLRRGKPVTVDIVNKLPEATTVHWHGLEISGEQDGGPQAIIALAAPARSVSRRISRKPPAGSTRTPTAKPAIRSRWDWPGWC